MTLLATVGAFSTCAATLLDGLGWRVGISIVSVLGRRLLFLSGMSPLLVAVDSGFLQLEPAHNVVNSPPLELRRDVVSIETEKTHTTTTTNKRTPGYP